MNEGMVPADREVSSIVNSDKENCDALERGNYRGMKLLEHVMKVVERAREKVNIDDMQFGFMPGHGTTDAIFLLRQLQEKYFGKKEKLYFTFVDFEKAFDRVPQVKVWWAVYKLGVEEWLVRVVQAMYTNAKSHGRVDGTHRCGVCGKGWCPSRIGTVLYCALST